MLFLKCPTIFDFERLAKLMQSESTTMDNDLTMASKAEHIECFEHEITDWLEVRTVQLCLATEDVICSFTKIRKSVWAKKIPIWEIIEIIVGIDFIFVHVTHPISTRSHDKWEDIIRDLGRIPYSSSIKICVQKV